MGVEKIRKLRPIKIRFIVKKNCTINDDVKQETIESLNHRQRWFIAQLQAGRSIKTNDICVRWKVSIRTAKTDLARMTLLKLICFKRPKKNRCLRLAIKFLKGIIIYMNFWVYENWTHKKAIVHTRLSLARAACAPPHGEPTGPLVRYYAE